ncbi:hypothetical protein EHI8A_151960 [Entamoeba histolytica HM-1:IMSS-B]|uniref:PX domain protein n=6 Tax=Entamoeba histolytica TaxID=5759 RepID=C4M6I9_ENTH1|nr:PX domain protein [Entamoeba histolytica HM-1:IMSS]EMD44175.1 PX domain containing protein [Entamoeba histolytica KU27]EMH77090.1 hypothetical protein EHI8A_151960 [Entamoeba histolytica HM-1:IMSS-B]EMS14722.1 sorting nexin-3, putative [Entamoeba histolytica HM-3:IMSS]ENY65658.1 sorting nexin-3, putative [Entamoeba histolytica HM-1:IMSS-A]GAT97105.1 px domain protein [Entamoeba histolytica]|eukprot:XP_653248.1 PX domain protein [Entamoeba histolytica HM-1:IMSS]
MGDNKEDIIKLNDRKDTQIKEQPLNTEVSKLDPLEVNEIERKEKKINEIESDEYEKQLKEEEEFRKKRKCDTVLSEAVNSTEYNQPEYIEVTVSSPELVVDSTGKYTVYTVTTRSSHQEYAPGNYSVKRRYSQFQSLRSQLKTIQKQSPQANDWGKIPKLPGDTFKSYYIPGYRFKPEFTEQRAKDLTRFINNLLKHPSYLFNEVTINFLTKPDFEIIKPKTQIVWGNGDESSSSSE